jgi:hypothetical protein
LAAGILDQPDRGASGAAGGDQIIDQQHPIAGVNGVDMDLDAVDTYSS